MKKISVIFISFLISIFLFSCASDKIESTSKAAPAQETIVTFPVPSKNLPKLQNENELSFVPQQTKYEKIYVKLFLPERPEENLVDIYIYDKEQKKYICCLENCYFDTIQQENFTGLGVLWSSWAKQNAYYLIDISKYALCDSNGNEY